MSSLIKDRILKINNEVKQLHPLLQTIFTKMPTIIKSDYTHGTNEKGADFILTKLSQELGDTEYIGVIAKIGKITQSLGTINEQIEECSLRRITRDGKKEIYLSEIWVVSNGTISNNACEKIYHKYKTRKIKFIDINRLYNLTAEYVPDYGIDVQISDANLLSKQTEMCAQREQKFSLLGNESNNSFIPQDIVHTNDDYRKKNEIVNIYKIIEERSFISVESQMGGGKTKLLNKLVEHFSNLETYKDKRIVPIYFGSKEIIDSEKSLIEIVDEKISGFSLENDERRKYLILVDGIDESKKAQNVISQRLLCLIEEANSNKSLKLVIASRSISNELINTCEELRNNRYEIEPLNLNGMIKFLEALCNNINLKNRLIQDLKKSELFKVLPKTPIAAIILAKLLTEGSEELPMNLTELYSKYCELTLGRWDVEKGIKTQKQYEALDAIVTLIAKYMIDNELPSLSKSEAIEIFKDYLAERNLQLDSDFLFNEMLERSGILIEDNIKNTIAFKHRSFAEFFYAKSLLLKQKLEIDETIFHPYWTSSFFFYIGLKRDCPELLEEIIDLPVKHEGHRFSRLLNLGSFLLAGYQSPYKVISKGINKIFMDAGDYYLEILEENNDSYFRKIPPIHLFALFSAILEQNYNFKFFENAINNEIENIGTSPTRNISSPYTLFFLDSIRYKFGNKPLFENLIDLYGNKLPVVIQLAIGHEAKQLKYNSPALKKMQRRIMKNRRTSRQFDASIIKFYTNSIDGSLKLDK